MALTWILRKMNKKGGLYTIVKEQILFSVRGIYLVFFVLIIIGAGSYIFQQDDRTEKLDNKITILNVQKCLDEINGGFSKASFEDCFILKDAGIGLSVKGEDFYISEEFSFFRDLCGFGYFCDEGYYVWNDKLVKIEVLTKDV